MTKRSLIFTLFSVCVLINYSPPLVSQQQPVTPVEPAKLANNINNSSMAQETIAAANITEKNDSVDSVAEPILTTGTSESGGVGLTNLPGESTVADKLKMQDKKIDTARVLKAPEKAIKDMNCTEALEARNYYDQQKETEYSMLCSIRMITVGSTQEAEKEEIRKATLSVAQKYLDDGKLEKAEKYAADYQLLYPGTPEAKDACYIGLKAKFMSMLAFNQDQTNTQQALEQAQNFLVKYKGDTKYIHEVTSMIDACYQTLFASECDVARCYLARYNYSKQDAALHAANRRVEYIKEKLLPYSDKHVAQLITLEIALAEAADKTDLVKLKREELEKKYPEESNSFISRTIKKIALRF